MKKSASTVYLNGYIVLCLLCLLSCICGCVCILVAHVSVCSVSCVSRAEVVLGEFFRGLSNSSVGAETYKSMVNVLVTHSQSESESGSQFNFIPPAK